MVGRVADNRQHILGMSVIAPRDQHGGAIAALTRASRGTSNGRVMVSARAAWLLPLLLVALGACADAPVATAPADAAVNDLGAPDVPVAADVPDASIAPDTAPDRADVAPFDAAPPPCTANADCAARSPESPLCDVASGRCVPCLPDNDARCALGTWCDPAQLRCVTGCRDDDACLRLAPPSGVRLTRCDTATRRCVECARDTHCPSGNVCMANTCTPGCSATQPCAAGLLCCDNACVDTVANRAHCGVCGNACSISNGVAACSAGRCVVANCNLPFANCDGDLANGCEADTYTSLAHCGDCNAPCSGPNATSRCVAGECQITACATGFGDCDGDTRTGCETDTRSTARHCGACGRACTAPAHATATCSASTCGFTCIEGFGDCDGDASNGCETDLSTSASHCGRCGAACSARGRCERGACVGLPTSCEAVHLRMPTAPSGRYDIALDGGAVVSAWCDMEAGHGYTFLEGTRVNGGASTVLASTVCPAGMRAFEVRSAAHAAALRRAARSLSGGPWFWANFFAGPASSCPTLAARGGWLGSGGAWTDASIDPAALTPLDMGENCLNAGRFDPVPLHATDGFTNRECTGCRVLYNDSEYAMPGTVVCAVNDVIACPAGRDDCDGDSTNGCETDTLRDPSHCGQCGAACGPERAACGGGTCQPDCRLAGAATCPLGRTCDFTSGTCQAPTAACVLSGVFAFCGGRQCGPGTYCDPATSRCLPFGACREVTCDSTGRCWGRDCPCERPATCAAPSLTALNTSPMRDGLVGVDIDDACNVYGSTVVGGTDYVRRMASDGTYAQFAGVSNLDMGEVAVQRAGGGATPAVAAVYACCAGCGCTGSTIQGVGLVDRATSSVPLLFEGAITTGGSALDGVYFREGPLGLAMSAAGEAYVGNLRANGDFFRLGTAGSTPERLASFSRRVHAATMLTPRRMAIALDNGDLYQLDLAAAGAEPELLGSFGAGVASMRADFFLGRLYASLADRRVVSVRYDFSGLRTLATRSAVERLALAPDGTLYLLTPTAVGPARFDTLTVGNTR